MIPPGCLELVLGAGQRGLDSCSAAGEFCHARLQPHHLSRPNDKPSLTHAGYGWLFSPIHKIPLFALLKALPPGQSASSADSPAQHKRSIQLQDFASSSLVTLLNSSSSSALFSLRVSAANFSSFSANDFFRELSRLSLSSILDCKTLSSKFRFQG